MAGQAFEIKTPGAPGAIIGAAGRPLIGFAQDSQVKKRTILVLGDLSRHEPSEGLRFVAREQILERLFQERRRFSVEAVCERKQSRFMRLLA